MARQEGFAFPAGKATAVVTCHRHVPKSRLSSLCKCKEKVAGTAGLEPANGGVKVLCLTAWLRPKIEKRASSPLMDNALLWQRIVKGFQWGE